MKNIYALGAITLLSFSPSISQGGISDLLVTNAGGQVYRVNGDTLQATEVVQLSDASSINEIAYLGDGRILANLTFAFAIYDLNTQEQETLFTSREVFGETSGFQYTAGIAELPNGDFYFSALNYQSDSDTETAFSYNLNTDSFTQYTYPANELPFDHHYVDNNTILSVNSSGLVAYDLDSESILENYNLGFFAVSLFESNDQLFVLDNQSNLYTLDLENRSSTFYGAINGISGNTIGATIPAPMSIACIGFASLFGTRRRR